MLDDPCDEADCDMVVDLLNLLESYSPISATGEWIIIKP